MEDIDDIRLPEGATLSEATLQALLDYVNTTPFTKKPEHCIAVPWQKGRKFSTTWKTWAATMRWML